jgi:hypothetical protein
MAFALFAKMGNLQYSYSQKYMLNSSHDNQRTRIAFTLTKLLQLIYAVKCHMIAGRKKKFEGTPSSNTRSNTECSEFNWLYCIPWGKHKKVSMCQIFLQNFWLHWQFFCLAQTFSNCGAHITCGTPATVQWYTGIVRRNQRIKRNNFYFNIFSYIHSKFN